ncbi:FirrV-1-A8 [Feldmannia irregularis virus a]|uniref:FirrV-1-A8 n=1 Tax=Feldmannia irregularis virus a TaxID=231992 RepID=Q6XM79_9PHYC|nr:FirrV-1-A8 [Feldmannia irregularis virus a]AAR26832.1 FirrV-1-A8 [Feldmannia irregularis virus a]
MQSYVKREISNLPGSFTSEEIDRMHSDLIKDMEAYRGHPHFDTVMCARHKTLAFSYPSLFYKTIKGDMEPHLLRSILHIKHLLDTGKISQDRAREMVVDGAKKQIEASQKTKNKSAAASGGAEQAFAIKCQVDEQGQNLRTVADSV